MQRPNFYFLSSSAGFAHDAYKRILVSACVRDLHECSQFKAQTISPGRLQQHTLADTASGMHLFAALTIMHAVKGQEQVSEYKHPY